MTDECKLEFLLGALRSIISILNVEDAPLDTVGLAKTIASNAIKYVSTK